MIYEKRGQWCVRINGQLKKFPTKAEAMKAAGMVDKGPDPLEALRAKAPMYNTFEDAVDDHGEDEDDLEEENSWS
jgi:hypothetical protein